MNEEKSIKSEQIYKGRVVQLRVDTVSLPDGQTKIREIVHHPGAAAIVALTNKDEGEDREVLLVEQYRKAVESKTLEIPAGTLEEGESPEECARRELIEETGFQASKLDKLVEFYPSPGFSSEIIHIFEASGLKKVSDVDAELPIRFVPLSELLIKIRRGEIKDGKTVIGVLMVSGGWNNKSKKRSSKSPVL
ncbi:MAG: NUDIX hydrolase [Methanophagales archaeon]|nr:NUDIX hydrolase [Methanophagales archaeon]MCW3141208.1 NUDIX hydrolase [Methanophagales archaeon]